MQCIACGRETNVTATRTGIAAAFCHYHYPVQQRMIDIVIRITC
ncbi:MAG TPA: hypothetical protein VJI12_00560 [archaeon]|nr:hypothetical protein [archaeon]